MMKALYTSATGMKAHQFLLDVISNNLANVNTTGYKRVQANFQDLLYDKFVPAGTESAQGIQSPTGLQVGSGVRIVATNKVFSQGVQENTGRSLDWAIQGDGFFQITHPDGTIVYSRDGTFQLNSTGEIVNSEGLKIEPSTTVPSDAVSINIGSDGTLSAQNADGSTQAIGNITLATFLNPSGLESLGKNLYRETTASGTPQTGTPGQNGVGEIIQGFRESSNVEVVTELVNLIVAQRAYETSAKAIKASDDMLQATNRIV
ncbi:flagellar basal body rod protein [Candidatus Scalindua japonica]|uniref:Flagellar basal-body rod protein FlgG n=1 Tax=Candidatus Scalindua japonica TaxID=1284222 RepID=A0A286TV78_9BACT|nr:flagellar basal-body rod protein FlgG [Candidatus Scalindua japonica]GAX59807.1 flagellar basal body rod protein [Candidatus Scalindua japonica]